MPRKNMPVLDLLVKAFKESKGETVDLVIEYDEIRGVTLEMLQWWERNHFKDTNDYRMWYPEDHISLEWEVPPSEGSRIRAIEHAEEKIGEFPASVLRIRGEDPSLLPISHKYNDFGLGSILGPDNKPIAWICHERKETPTGLKMRSIFRFPAKAPERFLDAMRKHCKGEMGHYAEFLPALYRQECGLK